MIKQQFELLSFSLRGRRGHDRWIYNYLQSVPIITKVVSSNPAHDEVYSIKHYVIMFVSCLRQVGAFFRVLQFSPPRNLTATI
jgi:hypothetical protein